MDCVTQTTVISSGSLDVPWKFYQFENNYCIDSLSLTARKGVTDSSHVFLKFLNIDVFIYRFFNPYNYRYSFLLHCDVAL